MLKKWLVTASFLLIVPLHGCSPSGVQTRGRQADPEGAWLQSHAHPLALEAENFDDLEFLRPLMEGKRIVQLGENTHGVREYNLLKARIVRFLHQELGYEVLAFESALYQCYDANLTADEASAICIDNATNEPVRGRDLGGRFGGWSDVIRVNGSNGRQLSAKGGHGVWVGQCSYCFDRHRFVDQRYNPDVTDSGRQ